MSIISDNLKAQKILKDVLTKKIKTYKEVIKALGVGKYYEFWAENIWYYHDAEAPSIDLKTRFPSKKQIKEYKIFSDNKYFIVNAISEKEALEKIKKETGKEAIITNTKFKVKWLKVK